MPKEKLELILTVISVSVFVLLLIISGFFLFRIYLKRKNKLLLEQERMNIAFEQTLLKSKLEIQENTFNDISREIHDNIGQVLSLVRINLNTLDTSIDADKLTLMDELMGKAITDLRNLSHSLNADHIRNQGWLPPVVKLLGDLQKTGRYTTHIDYDENLSLPGSDKPIILFRMIQEIINNIIRHAAANTIHLEARKEADGMVIKITDNGKGFEVGKTSGGVGLQNLRNRAKMINADVVIESEPGNGTTVIISIKKENDE